MKVLFLTVLLALTPVLQQQQQPVVEREDPDVVVLKFNWNKIRLNNDLIHSALDPGPPMNEPVRIKPPEPKNESQEAKNRRDMNERRAEMSATMNARKSQPKDPDQYLLQLEVKNVGTNVIKMIVWEYWPTPRASEYELRQYVCNIKAKPNENKKFELLSPSNPMKVIEADVDTGKAKDGKVVINRIDYADGSTWKRKGWSVLIPSETLNGLGNGKCLMF
ncbi:MAG TPA: hypothetical protein VFM63_04025 [Pyrinomonadaceae bacterium]|nr:hypothetical protein [Pyrinomonadaceae bacterium]